MNWSNQSAARGHPFYDLATALSNLGYELYSCHAPPT